MARVTNGFVGNFATTNELEAKFPAAEYAGCSANVGLVAPYSKAWCDGVSWNALASAPIQALVSEYGNYAIGSLAFHQLPNNTLTDTTTVEQQIAVATIPGGVFGTTSHLELGLIGQCAGVGSKGVGFKVGLASAGIAGATRIGGVDAGLTTHYVGLRNMMWGNGVLGAQRASPVSMADWGATNLSATIVTLGIDTSLDWNVYAYVDFDTTGGTNSFILRSFWGEWKR